MTQVCHITIVAQEDGIGTTVEEPYFHIWLTDFLKLQHSLKFGKSTSFGFDTLLNTVISADTGGADLSNPTEQI